MFNISNRIVNKALKYFLKEYYDKNTDTLIYDFRYKGKPYSVVITIQED